MPEDFVPKPFRCEISQGEDATHVRPDGDLDMGTADELDGHLRRVHESGAARIVVDLRGLSFMDSTGITLLTRWNNAAARDGFRFELVQGHERIARLFKLTGLHEYFSFVPG
jgi:anti-sigma B factor antagonist